MATETKTALSFGTGGMRAVTGPDSHQLNIQNIARLNFGLAAWYKKQAKNPSVVIAYDSRLTSAEFSRVSYHVLKLEGFNVKIFRRPTPTPMLSFAVRELRADCGIVLTASHNPPQYNGYKAYGNDGGQIVSPIDKEIQKLFEACSIDSLPKNLAALAVTPIPEADLIEEEIYQAYMARLKKEVFYTHKEKAKKILYSPLHGTGGWLFKRAFTDLGYQSIEVLAEQAEPDGNFPTVKSPNPEEPSAFERLLAHAAGKSYDLLVATDPDADRVGCMVKQGTGYQFLTGNQIGSLLLESIARKKTTSLTAPYICKTIVTTELQRLIADQYNIRTAETLTGFKYIASEISTDPDNYLFGGEESFGYLPVSWVRDKDSLSSAVALAELSEDVDLAQALDDIYLRHGLFHELLHNIDLTPNPALLKETMDKLNDAAGFIQEVDLGREVYEVLDLRKGAAAPQTHEGLTLKLKLGDADVIQFWLKDHSRLTIRPSGTEPKVKAYLSLKARHKSTRESLPADKLALKAEAEGILKKFLAALNL